jgi:hypothetical protein
MVRAGSDGGVERVGDGVPGAHISLGGVQR